jgi:hypothetical protein
MAQINPLGKSFFAGIKKYCFLETYIPLRSRGDKEGDGGLSQKKLQLSMELTDRLITGVPGWISDGIEAIAKDDAGVNRIVYDKSRVMPGMTMEFFATADTKDRALLLTACEFSKFTIERQGLAEKTRFWLNWQVRCADPIALHQWLHGHLHSQFAVLFSQGQETIDFDAAADAPEKPEAESPQMTLTDSPAAYVGENANTMSPERDEEFATAGTVRSKPRQRAAVLTAQ